MTPRQKPAALRDSSALYVRYGSNSTGSAKATCPLMSAMAPIATHPMRHNELTRSAKQTKGWRPASGKPGKGSMTLMATWSAGGGVQWRSAPGYPAFVRAHCPDCASAASLDPHHPAASLPADRFYDRAGVAVIGAPSSSEWPQTIFSGQISSSLDPKTSRIVEAMIHMAMPAAMSGSKME